MFVGVWSLWFVLAALLTVFMPDAAIALAAPTLAAAAVFASAPLLPEKTRPGWLLLTLVVAVPTTLGTVLLMEQSQGYRLIAATFPLFGLFLTALSPFLIGPRLKGPLITSGALTLAAIVWTLASPLYSAWRPQHLNIQYYEDMDAQTAFIALQSPNPVGAPHMATLDFNHAPRALMPFSSQESTKWRQTARSKLPAPVATVTGSTATENGRIVDLTLVSPRGADSLGLVLPEAANLTEFRLDGQTFTPKLVTRGSLKGQYAIVLRGTYERTVRLQLTLGVEDPVEANLFDASTELPGSDAAALVKNRPPLASPVHRGDQAYLMRKVSL